MGRKLAERLNSSFVDLDDKIEEQAGQVIPDIFKQSGETAFRSIERRTLLEISREFEGVVALGGGSLQTQELVDHIKQKGLLIFIETPISVILDRISGDEDRPLLLDEQGNSKSAERLRRELKALYRERKPLYEQAAIKVRDNGNSSPEELAQTLLKKVKYHV